MLWVIRCPNKMSFAAATNIRNNVFVHECGIISLGLFSFFVASFREVLQKKRIFWGQADRKRFLGGTVSGTVLVL